MGGEFLQLTHMYGDPQMHCAKRMYDCLHMRATLHIRAVLKM
jgi:hypothetical protein